MKAAGIIFSHLHERRIPELTRLRTMASVPFACRYRLIDFALSNMVNAGIEQISIITQNNYRSLMEHIGSGKDWDLARRSGGIRLLPPFLTANAADNAHGISRLDALKRIWDTVQAIREPYVLLSDCDVICNLDFGELLRDHIAHGADLTMVVKRIPCTTAAERSRVLYASDADGRILDCSTQPPPGLRERDVGLNIWVASRSFLQHSVQEAIAHGSRSFTRDVIAAQAARRNFRVYRFTGSCGDVSSLAAYFRENMVLLTDPARRAALFGAEHRPILTKVQNSPPTAYAAGASVSNSMIADGCQIAGRVENSVIFRGVRVARGAVVRNSILFQGAFVGAGAALNCVIADKNTAIRDGICLSGHAELPFYLDKGTVLQGGIG